MAKLTPLRVFFLMVATSLAIPAVAITANYQQCAYEKHSACRVTAGWGDENPTYELTLTKREGWLPGPDDVKVPIDAARFSQLELEAVSTAEACGSHTTYIVHFK